MDRFDRMRLFARLVERRSFTAAAADLGLPRSTATAALQQLEASLGVRLLERSTRHVAPTLEGQAYYERCTAILAEVEEAEDMLRDTRPRGLLRIDAHPRLTQSFLLPALPDFMARHPLISLQLGQGDRLVDLLREGVDCAIRAGEPEESGLIRRPLGQIREVTVASPGYLAAQGAPESIEALEGHQMVGFLSSRSGEVMPLEFTTPGGVKLVRLPCRLTVNNADSLAELARLGFGLVQAPRYRFAEDLAAGRLVEVLPDHPPLPMPLSALYPQRRLVPPRLRVFLDWVGAVFAGAAL
ncbi:LysR family transcriptional regulator [Pseudoroseomonas deserti]|uniref:LysR family transcriptional regulator n=1 Tax=Teichococcus deserti TaxID=1817963 RepID=A0A1V2H809_9PROT|nr:LysR family transcriptional regulator [Pseudoroseomonas deserti]ONG58338.1 LysR family transcriptional regulator [Pseudoroseomonas deserti]